MNEEDRQIGEILRSARETAGLGVEDVVFRTGLPRSVVEALEAEDFSSFASPVYARSFLSQYSDFLNVDAHGWLEALEPGSFSAAGLLHPLVEPPADEEPARNRAPGFAGGWITLLGLSAISVGIVVASIKGYEFFESRFGGENRKSGIQHQAPPVPAAAAPVTKAAEFSDPAPSTPAPTRKEDTADEAPPRAIIVR